VKRAMTLVPHRFRPDGEIEWGLGATSDQCKLFDFVEGIWSLWWKLLTLTEEYGFEFWRFLKGGKKDQRFLKGGKKDQRFLKGGKKDQRFLKGGKKDQRFLKGGKKDQRFLKGTSEGNADCPRCMRVEIR
jgi:hypothetical protein